MLRPAGLRAHSGCCVENMLGIWETARRLLQSSRMAGMAQVSVLTVAERSGWLLDKF